MEKPSPKQPCECKRKCATKFPQAWRESLCNNFWSKCETERNEEVKRLVKEKKHGNKPHESQRNRTFFYELENEKYEKIPVCKHFFLTSLGYERNNDKILARVFSNSFQNNDNVKHCPKPPCECRRNCRDKIPEVTREKICDYYWSLSVSERRKLLKDLAKPTIYRYKIFKRKPYKSYNLPISKSECITVCKRMFLATFGHGPNADRVLSWTWDPTPTSSIFGLLNYLQ